MVIEVRRRRWRGGIAPGVVSLGCTWSAVAIAPDTTAAAQTLAIPGPQGSWTCTPDAQPCTFGSDGCWTRRLDDPNLGQIGKPAP